MRYDSAAERACKAKKAEQEAEEEKQDQREKERRCICDRTDRCGWMDGWICIYRSIDRYVCKSVCLCLCLSLSALFPISPYALLRSLGVCAALPTRRLEDDSRDRDIADCQTLNRNIRTYLFTRLDILF